MPKAKHKDPDYTTKWRQERRRKVLAILGDVCVRCGFSDERALQIDHVHGNGSKEYGGGKGRVPMQRILRGETEDYQLLCANCNWIKRAENKEWC